MPDLTARDAKLVQYLNEAYGKERQLETALQAHIAMTTRATYKKRLQDHLKETKQHAREVERRIKKLGGTAEGVDLPGPDAVSTAAGRVLSAGQKAAALAQGQVHLLRGTGEAEKQLKNAKSELTDEAEEIANYTAIEALASAVGDRETAQLARSIRRDEERMSSFLEKEIPRLTKAVATEEIPAAERRTARRSTAKRRTSSARSGSTASTGTRAATRSASGRAKTGSASGRAKTRSSGGRAKTTRASSSTRASGSTRSASGKRASTARGASSSRSTTRRSSRSS